MLSVIEKFKNWKIILKNYFVRLLAGEIEKLAGLWHVDTASWIIAIALAD